MKRLRLNVRISLVPFGSKMTSLILITEVLLEESLDHQTTFSMMVSTPGLIMHHGRGAALWMSMEVTEQVT